MSIAQYVDARCQQFGVSRFSHQSPDGQRERQKDSETRSSVIVPAIFCAEMSIGRMEDVFAF
jgi:hypothetical protein